MEHKASETNHIQSTISTLRKENGWYSSNDISLYQYQGFWYYSTTLEGILSDPLQSRWSKLSPTDTLICGYPKCGLTWLKSLAFAITTRNRYKVGDDDGNPLLHSLSHDLIPYIEFHNIHGDIATDLPLFSTHMPFSCVPKSVLDSGCKMIYICRDPKDVFVSLWHFLGKTKPNKDYHEMIPLCEAFDLFCDGISVFGSYWDHVLGYWNASIDHPSKILFLKYEDMMKDPIMNVIRVADFMGYPFSNDERIEDMPKKIAEMCSFKSLSNLKVNKSGTKTSIFGTIVVNDRFFRKGAVGDWENHLTPEMKMKIDHITKHKFGSFGLHL